MKPRPLYARRYLLIWIRFHNRWGLRFKRWGQKLQDRAKRATDKAVEDYRQR